MSKVMAKPLYPENGYNSQMSVRLIKKAKLIRTKAGKLVWNATGLFEKIPKGVKDNRGFINITAYDAAENNYLASQLIEFEKNTMLHVDGWVVRDDYWTNHTGVECYKMLAEFVTAQPNYAEAARQSNNTARNYESETSEDADFYAEDSYDPGF